MKCMQAREDFFLRARACMQVDGLEESNGAA